MYAMSGGQRTAKEKALVALETPANFIGFVSSM
jgi:hypothetical protein